MTPIKFGPNSVVKRVKAARIQEGQDLVRAKKRKRQPASKDAESSDELQRLPQPEPESEASRTFRISQGELQDAVRELDPEYDLRQMGLLRKQPRLDRELIPKASKEGERGKE